MPTDVIDTVAESVEPEPTTPADHLSPDELAMLVVCSCGRTKEGNMCARPVVPPELMLAEPETVRDAILTTIPPKWRELLPNLETELEAASDNQLRMLLVMNSCFWCMGRIEGTLEERARHDNTEPA